MENNIVLGIDFGSSAVRVLTLELSTGNVLNSVEQTYEEGANGVYVSETDSLLARQNAADYVGSMKKALAKAKVENKKLGLEMSLVKGIGVDATGSTPLPVTKEMIALSSIEEFKNNLNAYAWMWKDHTSHKEADFITKVCGEIRPKYLDKIGGAYSSEWFWAKILRCKNVDQKVFDAAYTWVELSDYIPAVLGGVSDVDQLKRNVCAAGHKGLYSDDWNGFPDAEFIETLHPDLLKVLNTLPKKTFSIEHNSGALSKEWADEFGLSEGIPIAMGILDAHAGGIGSGIKEGSLVKIIGTSTCDLVLGDLQSGNSNIEGVASVATESVLPGFYGIESGQSAVGDILNWFIKNVVKNTKSHGELTEEAAQLKVGSSGLIALDWNNGNRCILSDSILSGLIIGQSLQTKDFEIYRALIESTAFGARVIIEDMERQGVVINDVVNCGGITHKNPLFMQIYADIINKPMKIAAIDETVALGAALMGAHSAFSEKGEPVSYTELSDRSCKVLDKVYYPNTENVAIYDQLYVIYKKLHDGFGVEGTQTDMYSIMKDLIQIKNN
ncbi:MAG: ribulokinase [Flavobacteriaceae bacterium]|nr:ribulokinase [Flavobacteriaceae bacterium]